MQEAVFSVLASGRFLVTDRPTARFSHNQATHPPSTLSSLATAPQRDFSRVGAAGQSELLPAWRKDEVAGEAAASPAAAAVQLYVKPIVELDDSVVAQPGKRIGF